MPTTIKFRRGTTSQNNSFTGGSGEISVDTTLKTLRVHDSSTAGGAELLNTTSTQTFSNKTVGSHLLPSADSTYDLGDSDTKWRALYVSGSTIHLGSIRLQDSGGQLIVKDSEGTSATSVVLSQNNTDDLSEGSTNLYHTTARVRSALSAQGDLSYDSSTGVFQFDVEAVYTKANFDSDFNVAIDSATTSDLSEGTNLYYTDERVDDRVNALFTDGEGITSTYDDAAGTLTVAGEDATASNKGIASFSSDNFAVSSGAVTIKDGGVVTAEIADDAVTGI